jgi:hypothetical protein
MLKENGIKFVGRKWKSRNASYAKYKILKGSKINEIQKKACGNWCYNI